MKTQGLLRRRVAIGIGVIAIGAMGTLSACAGEKKEAPTTTTPAPSVTPTEKGLTPGGGNKFTPTVKAPPAPTAIPGDN